jgi:hypothetical protein
MSLICFFTSLSDIYIGFIGHLNKPEKQSKRSLDSSAVVSFLMGLVHVIKPSKNQPHRNNAAVEIEPADFSVSLEESSTD